MTSSRTGRQRVIAELERVLEVVCTESAIDAVAAALGRVERREPDDRSARIASTRLATIEAVELVAWRARSFGTADLLLAAATRLTVGDLESILGPMRIAPAMDAATGLTLSGRWERPGLRAWAAVYAKVRGPGSGPDRAVTALAIRMEPVRD